jgi:hypothetical protein
MPAALRAVDELPVDYIGYIDRPDWGRAEIALDWRCYVSRELRARWDSFTYPQKWAIAQNAGNIAAYVSRCGKAPPVDWPDRL